jgi:hypothetical protein
MPAASRVAVTSEQIAAAAQYLREAIRQNPGVDAAALFTINGKCIWASDRSLVQLAPDIGRIGVASLRLWAKLRPGPVQRVGLMTDDGLVEIIFVPPLASLLVVSGEAGRSGWPEGEPAGLLAALDLN